jgi:hypothetical protein
MPTGTLIRNTQRQVQLSICFPTDEIAAVLAMFSVGELLDRITFEI